MILNRLADLTDEQRKGVVLIDFYKDDCGPCALMEPTINALANEFPGITVVKANVAEHVAEAAQMNVQAFPTIFILANGDVRYLGAGRMPAARLRTDLQFIIDHV